MTQTVAIIPARGGSKGIPSKNLQIVGGVPLIIRAIRSCQSAQKIDLVVVSTDDDKIADIAIQAGARVIRRPAELSTDSATSESALLHVIDELRAEAIHPEFIAFVQCTTPFIDPSDIDGTIQLLDSFDSAFTAAPTHRFIWKLDAAGAGVGVNHKLSERKMRQELSQEFTETGAVCAFRTADLINFGHRFSGRVGIYVVPIGRAMEIDEPIDLEIARALANHNLQRPEPDLELLLKIRAVVFDFDGVMTNNRVLVSETGIESVMCNRGDGLGIEILKDLGISMLILSKERNQVVKIRANKLNIEVIYGCDDKPAALTNWLNEHSIGLNESAYIGNDINDIECMKLVGLAISPSDAHWGVTNYVSWVLQNSGGDGAVREFADIMKNARNQVS